MRKQELAVAFSRKWAFFALSLYLLLAGASKADRWCQLSCQEEEEEKIVD